MPDEPGEIVRWRTVSWDVIDLPGDRFDDHLPVKWTARDPFPFPNRAFTLEFEYNGNSDYYTWRVLLDEVGEIIPWTTVRYAEPYVYDDYIGFAFVDFKRDTREATPETIGDDVELIAWPGSKSPSWDEWLARQEILERELPRVGAL